ncbi:hypothetical protein BP6252_06520 [Coleophoma cylindrospora]|uniref:Transcription factor domain-containing protein n=1 Tax=Coleophoma cylindrospora TaxID=1849047 RepID=A0A3D8RN55_9HELO|nr:hypothetical protein BP6252_06520 [Coleophoma cylindrospora]
MYANIIQDFSVLKYAISIGLISDLVRRRAKDPTPLAYHCAELCSAMNALLAGPQQPSRQTIIMHGIVALALTNLMMGKYQEWHIHMKGLRSLIPDQKPLPPSLQWLAVSVKVDPDPLMEQSYILWSELLSRPVPMWRLQNAMVHHQASKPRHASLVAAKRSPRLDAAIEEFAFPRCIECAMRIALLMYAKKMSSYQGGLV